jgi:peptidoglycan/xylan/chitin deacetylase (PgdA/CDA1 family)
MMERRVFLESTLGALAAGVGAGLHRRTTHLLTLSFDDGFRKSFFEIAEIHEQVGLRACLNVIASGHLPSFKAPDDWIEPGLLGDFDDWNALQRRGHEVMPHSYDHRDLTKLPFDEATALIDTCLGYFEANLEGFQAREAVYNFAFNASTPELEAYALSKVRAIRTHGESARNAIPTSRAPVRLGCESFGPETIDAWIEQQVQGFLASAGGWLVLNTHGLDGEGWGPTSSDYLRSLLGRLVNVDTLEVLPAGEVLRRYPG